MYNQMHPHHAPVPTPAQTPVPTMSNLDILCNWLAYGVAFHKRLANQSRKIKIRGWGRWHDHQACHDTKELLCLEKVLMDKLGHVPSYDYSKMAKAETLTLKSIEDFKQSHLIWKEHEEKMLPVINALIAEYREKDMELYKKFCCIANCVQMEIMRLQMAYDRLEFSGWNHHDIGICSMIVHKYFEEEHKSGHDINFNLG